MGLEELRGGLRLLARQRFVVIGQDLEVAGCDIGIRGGQHCSDKTGKAGTFDALLQIVRRNLDRCQRLAGCLGDECGNLVCIEQFRSRQRVGLVFRVALGEGRCGCAAQSSREILETLPLPDAVNH